MSNKLVATKLINILDDIDLAMNQGATSMGFDISDSRGYPFLLRGRKVRDFLDGIDTIRKKIVGELEGLGIEEVRIQPGDLFDYKTMECVADIESPGNENKVISVQKKGYKKRDVTDTPFRCASVITGASSKV